MRERIISFEYRRKTSEGGPNQKARFHPDPLKGDGNSRAFVKEPFLVKTSWLLRIVQLCSNIGAGKDGARDHHYQGTQDQTHFQDPCCSC